MERRTRSLLEHEEAFRDQVRNGPRYAVRARTRPVGQMLEQLVALCPALVAIDLEIAAHGPALSARPVVGLERVAERRPQLGPVARRLDRLPLNAPLARSQAGHGERRQLGRRARQEDGELRELAVVREQLQHHLELGNKAHRLERQHRLRNPAAWCRGVEHSVQPLCLTRLGVQEAAHPFLPAVAGAGLDHAQRVLQHAARHRLPGSESQPHALGDLAVTPGRRFEIGPEQVAHAREIRGSFELGEIGVHREGIPAGRPGKHRVRHGLGPHAYVETAAAACSRLSS